MHTIFSLLTFLTFAQENIPFKPIYPINTTIYENTFTVQWEILEEGYEYKLEILRWNSCSSVKISFPYIEDSSKDVFLSQEGEYCWRLKYRLVGEESFLISPSYDFTYTEGSEGEEIEEEVEDEIIEEEEDDEERKEELEGEEYIGDSPIQDNPITVDPPLEKVTIANKVIKKDTVVEGQHIEESNEKGKVLGVENKVVDKKKKEETPTIITKTENCHITYDMRSKKYSKENCSFEFPNITEIKRYAIDERFDYIILKGDILKEIEVEVSIIDCERFTIFNPSTWFQCVKKKEIKYFTLPLIYSPTISISKKKSVVSTYDINNEDFLLKIFSEKLNNEEISLTFDIYFYINISGSWLNLKDSIEKKLDYSLGTISNGEKPLRYVFEKIVGVTQWHGYTAYASPHPGIDFGSVKEKILSPYNGTIYAIGWDDYYGECNSGGRYLKIKHDNGMYTVYMHLENYKKENGKNWKVGEKVRKGEQIGTSGNSGAYNCQPLGYHLHYELRKNSQQSSHTNPVPYTDIDWNLISTINWKTYPGRLSGDNPHPNF